MKIDEENLRKSEEKKVMKIDEKILGKVRKVMKIDEESYKKN